MSSDSQKAKTKAAVIAAARTLFIRFGHSKTSVEEIAREAGLSKATVYNHFGGKEAIVAGVIELERREMREKLRAAVERAPDPLRALQVYFRTRIFEVQHRHRTYRAGREDLTRHMPQVVRAIQRNRREERIMIEEILRRGIEEGVFRTLGDLKLTADIFFTTAAGFTFPLFSGSKAHPAARKIEELITLFLVGICSDETRLRALKKEQQ